MQCKTLCICLDQQGCYGEVSYFNAQEAMEGTKTSMSATQACHIRYSTTQELGYVAPLAAHRIV